MQWIAERIEGVADIDERGEAEIPWQIANHLGGRSEEVPTAYFDAAELDRREIVEAEAAYAAIAAGEKALRAGQVRGIGD